MLCFLYWLVGLFGIVHTNTHKSAIGKGLIAAAVPACPPHDRCSMEFVAEQARSTTPIMKAFINHSSAPFLPDIVAIDYKILLMDSQKRQARAKAHPNLMPPPSATQPKVESPAGTGSG